MRRSLRGAVGLVATGLLAAAALSADAAPRAENRLLGVHIWHTYKQVLARLGQPTSIEPGDATSTGAGGGAPTASIGLPGGGAAGPMMPSGLSGPGGRGMLGEDDRPRGGGGAAMMPGGSPYAAMMGSMYGRAQAGRGLPGISGMPAPGGQLGGVATGPPPGVMMGGPMMGGAMVGGPRGPGAMIPGGAMGLGGPGAQTSQTTENEVTWIYKRGNNTHRVLFNRDGRVIQIETFGYSGSGATSRGVGLGDPLSEIYAKYGWTHNVSKTETTMTLNYSRSHNVIFYLASRGGGFKVVGIAVALTEKDAIPGQ